MTQSELEKCRKALKSKQVELIFGNRGRSGLAVKETADEPERTQRSRERDLAIDSLLRNATLLRNLRSALGRIDAGTFAVCVNCKSDIVGERLVAVPWAALCITCQEVADAAPGEVQTGTGKFLTSAA